MSASVIEIAPTGQLSAASMTISSGSPCAFTTDDLPDSQGWLEAACKAAGLEIVYNKPELIKQKEENIKKFLSYMEGKEIIKPKYNELSVELDENSYHFKAIKGNSTLNLDMDGKKMK